MREKLIRNLAPGDEVRLYDATKVPTQIHRVSITHIQEGPLEFISRRRTWRAYFEPHLCFGSWTFITGRSNDKIEVFDDR